MYKLILSYYKYIARIIFPITKNVSRKKKLHIFTHFFPLIDQIFTRKTRFCCMWGYSSVVEHLTADQEVPSSNLGAPFSPFVL